MAGSVDLGTIHGSVTLNTQPMTQALQDAQGTIRNWGRTAGRIAAGAGVAIAGALAGAMVGAMDLEPVRSKIKAQLGLSEEEAARAGKAASLVYQANWGESMADATQMTGDVIASIEGLRSATDEEIARVTGRIATISETFDVEAQLVANTTNEMVKGGMAKNIDEATDIMAASYRKVPAAAREELNAAYNEYTKHAADLGMSAASFSEVLVQAGIEGGAIGVDKAGDAIKEFSLRAQDGSETTKEAFSSLGLNAKQMAADIAKGGPAAEAATQKMAAAIAGVEDPMERNRIGVALMGSAYEDIGEGQEGFLSALSGTKQVLGETAGSIDEMSTALGENAAANIEVAKRKVIAFAVDGLGAYVLPIVAQVVGVLSQVLVPVLKALGSVLEATVGWFQKYQGWITPIVAGLGTFAAAVGLVVAAQKAWLLIQTIMAAGGFIRFLLPLVQATKAYAVAQGILNAVMAINPIFLVIAAVVALVAALVLAYKKSETFRNFVNGMWSSIKSVAGAVGAWFSGPFKDFFVNAWNTITATFTTFKQGFLAAWNAIVGGVVGWVTNMWSNVTGIFSAVVGFFAGIWATAKDIFALFVGAHVAAWQQARDWVVGLVMAIRDQVVWFFTGLRDGVMEIILGVSLWLFGKWEEIRANTIGRLTAMKDGALWLFESVRGGISDKAENIRSTVNSKFESMRSGAIDLITRMKTGAENLFNDLLTAARNIFNGLPDSIKGPVREAVKWLNDNFIGKINSTLESLKIDFRVPKIPGFATGRVPGHTPTDSSDNTLAWLTPGETVLRRRSSMGLEQRHPGLLAYMNAHGQLPDDIPGYAGGAMPNSKTKPWPRYVAALARKLFPGIGDIYGQGDRPIRTSYHHTGDALDLMVHRNRGLGNAIAAWGTKNASPLRLDQLIWYNRIQSPVNGRWRPYRHPNGNNPTLNHEDHPHFSFSRGKWGQPELLGQQLTPEEVAAITAGSGGGGIGFDFSVITKPLQDLLSKWDTSKLSPWSDIVKAAATAIPNAIVSKVQSMLPAMGSSGSIEEGGALEGWTGKAGVEQWRPTVLKALQMLGLPATLAGVTLRRMNQESGGNPRAINNWDVNAKRGTPSKGLMQVIDPTFRQHMMPGYTNIWDPLSNILASMRYTLKRYGSLPAGYNRSGGYALGTNNATAGLHLIGENGPELVLGPSLGRFGGGERVIPLSSGGQGSITPEMIRAALDGMRVDMDNGKAWFTRHASERERDASRRIRAFEGRL